VSLLHCKYARNRTKLRAYTTLRCPFNGHQASWCRQLCVPTNGRGVCGRLATHGMLGRTQLAIARYQQRQRQTTL
jgi:hypothetical protein